MVYTEAQLFVCEILGTFLIVYFGNGGIANALLPGTKGHGIGFLGIAFSFGWGVWVAVQFFGLVTGFFNPAVALGAAVLGELSWERMLVCWVAEAIGGFLGGLFVWFTYLPHFQPLELLDEGPSELSVSKGGGKSMEEGVGEGSLSGNTTAVFMQRCSSNAVRYASGGNQVQKNTLRVEVESTWSPLDWLAERIKNGSSLQGVMEEPEVVSPNGNGSGNENGSRNLQLQSQKKSVSVEDLRNVQVRPRPSTDPSVEARVAEDQEMKLVVFCTRPSIVPYYYIFCFWTEMFGTFLLTFGAMTILNVGKLALSTPPSASPLAAEILSGLRMLYTVGLAPLLIGFLVFVIILIIGGMTGPALNPARDLMPRLVHWMLPIPGKGSSEWWYSWVPVVAPCAGGVIGALFAEQIKRLIKSHL